MTHKPPHTTTYLIMTNTMIILSANDARNVSFTRTLVNEGLDSQLRKLHAMRHHRTMYDAVKYMEAKFGPALAQCRELAR